MITGGTIKRERLVLATESSQDALNLKRILTGNSVHLTLPPYANHIDLFPDDKNLILVKHNSLPYTYDEIHNLTRRIEDFGWAKQKTVSQILDDARGTLEIRHTSFFPSYQEPRVEVCFGYNWIFVSCAHEPFQEIVTDIQSSIEKSGLPWVVHANHNRNFFMLFNYSLEGIYLDRKTVENITNIIEKHGVLKAEEKSKFALHLMAFSIKTMAYMEAWMLSKSTQECPTIEEMSGRVPTEKKPEITPIMDLLSDIFQKGTISALTDKKKDLLNTLASTPESVLTSEYASSISRRSLKKMAGYLMQQSSL